MRQCVCLHVGQAGVQMGNSMWELFCIEHGINPNGSLINFEKTSSFPDYTSAFFQEGSNGKLTPRVVMVDLEPTVLDEVRGGKFKELFHPDQLMSGKEDAANNFARGHYTVGKNISGSVFEAINKVVEQCESLLGFILFHSGGGGTGSGFGTLLMENIVHEFPKKTRLEYVVYPAPQVSSAVVEPYNSVLSTHNTLECDYSDCSVMVDNEALYNICHKKLNIDRPNFSTLNKILAQVVSSITASLRFEGVINVDLSELNMNLVPYPRLHYPVTAYSPIITKTKVFHEQFSIHDLTMECFDSSNQLVKCDAKTGKFIACCLLYRGDIIPKEINTTINMIRNKRHIRFVDWCPTGFKIGINYQQPSNFPADELAKIQRGVCMLGNSTSIVECWDRLGKKFDLMFNKKAFVHWFITEGMEEDEFVESRSDLEALHLDYLEVQKDLTPFMQAPELEL